MLHAAIPLDTCQAMYKRAADDALGRPRQGPRRGGKGQGGSDDSGDEAGDMSMSEFPTMRVDRSQSQSVEPLESKPKFWFRLVEEATAR